MKFVTFSRENALLRLYNCAVPPLACLTLTFTISLDSKVARQRRLPEGALDRVPPLLCPHELRRRPLAGPWPRIRWILALSSASSIGAHAIARSVALAWGLCRRAARTGGARNVRV
jgi:hypothetical protein